jgi:hypothetical protein
MFASEMTDKSNVVGASDDDARLTFADDANVAVISDCLLRLGRCETAGQMASRRMPPRRGDQ